MWPTCGSPASIAVFRKPPTSCKKSKNWNPNNDLTLPRLSLVRTRLRRKRPVFGGHDHHRSDRRSGDEVRSRTDPARGGVRVSLLPRGTGAGERDGGGVRPGVGE